jgi:hypothetical protein
MASTTEPLDLVDIAVLLNYERATTDDRFLNTKLREIAFPGRKLSSISPDPRTLPKGWNNNERTWIVLDEVKTQGERQLPTTMKMERNFLPPALSDQQLETIFHRVRAYDSCAAVTVLLKNFFELFPEDTKLLIRHAPKDQQPGVSYVTSISNRCVITDKLIKPKFSTVLCLPQKSNIEYTGTEPEMPHWYTAFYAPGSEQIMSVLDLASMQFGEAGRGPGEKGKMLVVLDTKTDYDKRLLRIAEGVDLAQRRTLPLMLTMYDANMDRVACKVKDRWEKRHTEKWCAHCGAPEPQFKCAGCGDVWFCNREHQKMVWSFHKGYCKKA